MNAGNAKRSDVTVPRYGIRDPKFIGTILILFGYLISTKLIFHFLFREPFFLHYDLWCVWGAELFCGFYFSVMPRLLPFFIPHSYLITKRHPPKPKLVQADAKSSLTDLDWYSRQRANPVDRICRELSPSRSCPE